jgi:hypothetical protein
MTIEGLGSGDKSPIDHPQIKRIRYDGAVIEALDKSDLSCSHPFSMVWI